MQTSQNVYIFKNVISKNVFISKSDDNQCVTQKQHSRFKRGSYDILEYNNQHLREHIQFIISQFNNKFAKKY